MQKIGDIPNSNADSNGEWTPADPIVGISATILKAGWFNTVQRELINFVEARGLELNPEDDTQLLAALDVALGDQSQALTNSFSGLLNDINPVVVETGTARTLTTADVRAYIRCTNSGPVTVTVPDNTTEAIAVNSEIHVRAVTAGTVIISPADGVTINAPTSGGLVLAEAGATATLKKVGANEWDIWGLLTTVVAPIAEWNTQSISETATDSKLLIGWAHSPTLNQWLMFEDDRLFVSEDGLSWGAPINPDGNTFNSISAGVHDGNNWVIAGAPGGGDLFTFISADGYTWDQTGGSPAISGVGAVNAIAADGTGKFVLGLKSSIYTSSDGGVTWSEYARPVSNNNIAYGAAYGNGAFVVYHRDGQVSTSTDGTTWSQYNTGIGTSYGTIKFIDGTFYVVAVNGSVASSTDGISWTLLPGKFSNTSSHVTWTGVQWVAISGSNIWATSDGDASGTWTEYASESPYLGSEIGYLGGGGGFLFYSPNPDPDFGVVVTYTGAFSS